MGTLDNYKDIIDENIYSDLTKVIKALKRYAEVDMTSIEITIEEHYGGGVTHGTNVTKI